MPSIELTEEERDELSFALSCRLEDYEREILASERKTGKRNDRARAQHARLQRLQIERLKPSILSGTLTLLDGTTITAAEAN